MNPEPEFYLPLTDDEFRELALAKGATPEAVEMVNVVRHSPASRLTRSTPFSVAGRFSSLKMRRSISFESHRGEWVWLWLAEHNDHILELFDQPGFKTPQEWKDPTTKKRRTSTSTPDFLSIEIDGIVVNEIKAESRLIKLSQEREDFYIQNPDGSWSCPSAESWAVSLGIGYKLWSTADLPQNLARNEEFLDAFLGIDPETVPENIVAAIRAAVVMDPGITIAKLLRLPELAKSADPLWILIAGRWVWVDLEHDPLADPDHTRVFADATVGQAFALTRPRIIHPGEAIRAVDFPMGATLRWDGRVYRVVNPGDKLISLASQEVPTDGIDAPRSSLEAALADGRAQILDAPIDPQFDARRREMAERIDRASEEDRHEMMRRVKVIREYREHKKILVPRTTFFVWLKAFEMAEALHGNGAYGLLPKPRSGNRGSRLGQAVETKIDEAIAKVFETTVAPKKEFVIGAISEMLGALAPSPKAIDRRIRARGGYRQDLARYGRKGSQGSEPYVTEIPDATPTSGDFPFHVIHIDSTKLDIELISSRTKRILGRPTLMVAVDAFKWRVRAYALRYEPPSQKMELEVHERTVDRWRRLGQTYVIDQGSEAFGTDVEMFLTAFGCSTKDRPPSKPRYGTPVEGIFNILNERVIHNLPGNTKAMKNVRAVSPESGPKTHAKLTLAELIAILDEFFFEIYDTMPQQWLEGLSPREAEEQAAWTGDRDARLIDPTDPLFRALICPTVEERYRKVDGVRGIKVDNHYYWHPIFGDGLVRGTLVWVRRNVRDIRAVWAFVQGRWIMAICREFRRIRPTSRDEISVITAEIEAADNLFRAGRVNRSRKIAEFIERGRGSDKVKEAKELADATRRPTVQPVNTSTPDGVAIEPAPASFDDFDSTPTTTPTENTVPDGGWSTPLPDIDETDPWIDFIDGDAA